MHVAFFVRHSQMRRQQKLESQLEKLQAICFELGEDDRSAAVDVHPSLRCMRCVGLVQRFRPRKP